MYHTDLQLLPPQNSCTPIRAPPALPSMPVSLPLPVLVPTLTAMLAPLSTSMSSFAALTTALADLFALTAALAAAYLDLNSLGLLRLRRRLLRHTHSQHPVLTLGRDLLNISIFRQHKLLEVLAKPPLHPQILNPLIPLLFSPPLPAHHQHVVVLNLNVDHIRPQPGHVHHKNIGVLSLLDVGWRGSHGLGLAHVLARRRMVARLVLLVGKVQ
ncbi:unnamed protein product [Prunus brigantina]